jgi:2-dehydropantoate 2-reductase
MAFVDTLPAAGTASLQRDIAEGKPSELESWSGAVVRLGREVGVPTPVHETIYQALLPSELRARGKLAYP